MSFVFWPSVPETAAKKGQSWINLNSACLQCLTELTCTYIGVKYKVHSFQHADPPTKDQLCISTAPFQNRYLSAAGLAQQCCCEPVNDRISLKAVLLSAPCSVSLCFLLLLSLSGLLRTQACCCQSEEVGCYHKRDSFFPHVMLLFTIRNIASTYNHCSI